ncbi:TPA: ATP-binding protein [Candidatus Woesearchaeota archaeon]|nr:ATP-binding protein [Candidatus Woesearchaeota archaeon]
MAKISLSQPTIILCVGAAGIGKTTVIKDVLRDIADTYLLEKDVVLEQFLHTNPFSAPNIADGKDDRYPFSSGEYTIYFKNQVYAAMLNIAFANAALGKSTVIDGHYLQWLDVPGGRDGLRNGLRTIYDPDVVASDAFRVCTLFFHVTDSDVVRTRIKARMAHDPAAHDRDAPKVRDDAAWKRLLEKEPAHWQPELDKYADIFGIDLTQDYSGARRAEIKREILAFLQEHRTLEQAGIYKDEPLSRTLSK